MEKRSEVALAAQAFYDEKLKSGLEPDHNGKFLVIDVDHSDYEVDADSMKAFSRLMERHPDGRRFLMRIGFPTAHRMVSFRPVRCD